MSSPYVKLTLVLHNLKDKILLRFFLVTGEAYMIRVPWSPPQPEAFLMAHILPSHSTCAG